MKGEKNLEIFDKWSINFSWKQDDTEKFLTEDLIFHVIYRRYPLNRAIFLNSIIQTRERIEANFHSHTFHPVCKYHWYIYRRV